MEAGPASSGAGSGSTSQNATDEAALANNNSSVLTDLSKLGAPGTQFTYDFFVTGTLITFPQAAVADVAKIKGVQTAVPALSLQALHESGTVPTVTDTVTTGGQTITKTAAPPPLTAAQEDAVRACLQASGAFGTTATTAPGATTATTAPRGTGGVRRRWRLRRRSLRRRLHEMSSRVVPAIRGPGRRA